MKRLLIIFLSFSLVALSVSGCDFFRKIAGRPTSSDIAVLTNAILNESRRIKLEEETAAVDTVVAVVDSVVVEEPVKVDTQEALSYYESVAYRKVAYDKSSGRYSEEPDKQYYLIIGFFSVPENAQNLIKKMTEEGFSPVALTHRNGKQSVALIASDSLQDFVDNLKKADEAGLCPKDSWILENRN